MDDSVQTDDTGKSDTVTEPAEEKDNSFVLMYGMNGEFTDTFYIPEGAEGEGYGDGWQEIMETYGALTGMRFIDDEREYYAYTAEHHNRFASTDVRDYILVFDMLYFDGALTDDAQDSYENCRQEVTNLGFQWKGKDVLLIDTWSTLEGYSEQLDRFVGVEYELPYTDFDDETGAALDMVSNALLGVHMYSTSIDLDKWDGLTKEQCAWIGGQFFGVDSGITGDPFAESESGTESEASIDASAIIGSWLDPESTWGTCFTFNADGTGARSTTVDGASKPFTYKVEGDRITVVYDGGEEAWYTVEPGAGTLTITDQFDNTAVYEAYKESAENGTAAGSGETLIIRYEDGDRSTFAVRVDGNQLILDRDWILLRQ